MQDLKIAKNYINALFANAKSVLKEEIVFQQIKIIEDIIQEYKEFTDVLYSPVVAKTDKFNLIEKLASNLKLDKILENFLTMVIKNSRENVLTYLLEIYKKLLDESKGIKFVEVKSSLALDENEKLKLKKYLESDLIKCNVEINYEQDSSIIGGITISYDNSILDLSVAGALKKIDDITSKTVI